MGHFTVCLSSSDKNADNAVIWENNYHQFSIKCDGLLNKNIAHFFQRFWNPCNDIVVPIEEQVVVMQITMHIMLRISYYIWFVLFLFSKQIQDTSFAVLHKRKDLRIVSSDATSLIAMRLNKIKRETEKRNTLNKSNWFEILENGIINKPGSISSVDGSSRTFSHTDLTKFST